MRNKEKNCKHFTFHPPSSQALLHSFISSYSTSSTESCLEGMGNRGCSQFTTLCLCHAFLFSAWGLLHGMQPFPPAAVLREQQWCESSPQVCVSGTNRSSVGPAQAAVPAPMWALHRRQLPWGHGHLLWCGVLHGLQGNNMLHHCPLHRLQENFCAGAESTTSLSLLLLWPWYLQGCFSHFFFFFTPLSKLLCSIFLPFLKYIFLEAPPVLLIGLAVLLMCLAV